MKILSAFFVLLFSFYSLNHAVADEVYSCKHANKERMISVIYSDQDVKLPCEVQYAKEGATQTLWRASSQVGYCEEKAQAFLEKQRGWGWVCDVVAAMPASDIDAESDHSSDSVEMEQ